MSKSKSLMDRVREEQNAKALEMAAKGVPLVHVPNPVSNETLEQRKVRAFDWLVETESSVYELPVGFACQNGISGQVGQGATRLEAVEDAIAKEGL